jgi:RimJ/RimL family protein N-acetyltransferase
MAAKALQTLRLVVRSFTSDDLLPIHRILERCFGDGSRIADPHALAERRSWLEWSILSQVWHPNLHQPPYGERAVELKANQVLIGTVGLVPSFDRFEQIPELRPGEADSGYSTPEVGLFWAVDPDFQRQGYATEAAQALVDYAFAELRLKRIIATTEYDNLASQAVMRKLGMRLLRNPLPSPEWLQVVGVRDNNWE